MIRGHRHSGLMVGVLTLIITLCNGIPGATRTVRQCLAADTSLEDTIRLFEKRFHEVAEKVKPAVVRVKTIQITRDEAPERRNPPSGGKDSLPFPPEGLFDDLLRSKRPKSHRQIFGSGVIVDPRGYILTTNFIAKDTNEVYVTLNDMSEFKASVTGIDEPTGLAVIKIEAEDLPVASMGDSDTIEIGNWVIAISDLSGKQLVTTGIVSATGFSRAGIAEYEDFIVTNAFATSEGSLLVNLRGEVIGINTAAFARSGVNQGISFAIPINLAKKVMKDLIETGMVTRGWLGLAVQDVTPDMVKTLKLPIVQGALVGNVTPNGPAEKGGAQRGDVIVEFENKKIGGVDRLRNLIAQTPPGKVVTIKVLRDGKPVGLSVTTGEQPPEFFTREATPKPLAGETTPKPEKDFGMSLNDLTPELVKRYGYEGETGVVVVDVKADSPAERAGVQKGDLIKEVNRKQVGNLEEYGATASSSQANQGLLLLVKHGNFTHYVTIGP